VDVKSQWIKKEHRIQNTEYRTQSTEVRAQNTDIRSTSVAEGEGKPSSKVRPRMQ